MFTTAQGKKIDLVQYIKDYLKTHNNIEILVGSDSQNTRKVTSYATVVVLYNPGHGGHVLYEKTNTPKELVRNRRLMNEVWRSVEIAELIKNSGLPKPLYIDIDINPNSRFKSSEVFKSAVGLIEGMGYACRYKTLGQVASCCADAVVRDKIV